MGISTEFLLAEDFDRSSITALRHTVTARAGSAGLTGPRLEDFVVAVNELLTNAVRHGGGAGRVRLWLAGGSVVCEVSDEGGGIAGPVPERPAKPPAVEPGGWGLWLAEELTDTFAISTGSGGTTVLVSSRTSLSDP